MNKHLILIVFLLVSQIIFTQEDILFEHTIPETLKTNANAVIRENTKRIRIESSNKMYVQQSQTVTIFNSKGNNILNSHLFYDNDVKINSLSLIIYDANGVEIKKFSKSKFKDINAVDGFSLYTDDRVMYIDYTPTFYPYTAVFNYEYKTKTTAFIPRWHPISSYNVSVQQSEYIIHNPNNLKIKFKENNFNGYHIVKKSKDRVHYIMNNQPAIKHENYSTSFIDLMPYLMVAVNNFTLKGVAGNASNWNDFGKWMHDKLLSNKTKVKEETITRITNLTKGVTNDIEKAKIVYRYMQNKTRYISVQIGIGGWEPITPYEVDNLGYGDCKALTIYTKALLDIVGVKSNYTLVYAGNNRDIDSSFTSIQGNHAILNIPNKESDIWLECTSQTLPFGFLGDFTENRNVLVITPKGGIIKRTPEYKNNDNLQTTNASIVLHNNGNVTASIERVSEGIQYDNKYHLENYSEKDLHDHYKTNSWRYVNNLNIDSSKIINKRDSIALIEKLKISIDQYATINNNEYIFNINTFNRNSYIPKRYRTRNLPLEIKHGFKDIDEYTFTIPNKYSLGLFPENKNIKSKFGEYSVSIQKIDNNTILYKRTILIKKGIYSKEDYKTYRAFRKQIAKQENLRLILKK